MTIENILTHSTNMLPLLYQKLGDLRQAVHINLVVKGGFKLSFYGGLKMYDLGGLGIDRYQAI